MAAQSSKNRVGLIVFRETVSLLVDMDTYERNQDKLRTNIMALNVDGGTAMYDALLDVTRRFASTEHGDHIRAIVVLSDGQDTDSKAKIRDVTEAIRLSEKDSNPLIIIPVAYGGDADISVLNAIAGASRTSVQSGDPGKIIGILQVISSFF